MTFIDRITDLIPLGNPRMPTTVLVVFDGWGDAPPSKGNAIAAAKTPNMNSYLKRYPHGQLIASGESVGLPANEVGNSEVGHLTIGVGRVVHQSLVRINTAIEDRSFFRNEAFQSAVAHVRKNNSRLHILGLASEGNVHSTLPHLFALIDFCEQEHMTNVGFHLFTDGRDAPPTSGINVIREVETKLATKTVGRIVSVTGRYWAMDRDGRWDRIEKIYNTLTTGEGAQYPSAADAIEKSYAEAKTDEFIEPSLIVPHGEQPAIINDHDAVIFFNFRIDRPRELTMAFTIPDFEHLKGFEWGYRADQGSTKKAEFSGLTFQRKKIPQDLFFVTMTEYQQKIPVSAIAFPPSIVSNSLTQVLSAKGMKQLHLAESEKERMVTFYFDGLRETHFENEDVTIVPSPNVGTYDKKPEMNAMGIARVLRRAIRQSKYHFIVLNFANPDMVGHSGNFNATVKAIEAVDKALGLVVDAALKAHGAVFITADHGNAEELLSFNSTNFFFTTDVGSLETGHSNNPVPFVIISERYLNVPTVLPQGTLSDVAPTILEYLDVPIPPDMTGRSLLPKK